MHDQVLPTLHNNLPDDKSRLEILGRCINQQQRFPYVIREYCVSLVWFITEVTVIGHIAKEGAVWLFMWTL